MANTTTPKEKVDSMTIYEKLLKVREEFLAAGIKKSGKNLHAEYLYYELEDIVPIAQPIFHKYGLIVLNGFEDGRAFAQVTDVKSKEGIVFSIPLQFISEPAKFRMNEIQGVGAAVTYYRRYLYMIILDLVEADDLDGGLINESKAKPAKAPVTPTERKAIKEELADPNAKADEFLIDTLKSVLSELLELDPKQEDFVQEIAMQTDAFTNIRKSDAESLIEGIREMIKAYGEGE